MNPLVCVHCNRQHDRGRCADDRLRGALGFKGGQGSRVKRRVNGPTRARKHERSRRV